MSITLRALLGTESIASRALNRVAITLRTKEEEFIIRSTDKRGSSLCRCQTHLEREGQRQVCLHLSTGRQHNLMRSQDAFGALEGNALLI